ncbi:protein kinase STUNTED isoform X2 [Spinacia oleracea]|uniref:Protein kinase STUNTED isoform X2 n=2 Tax=Spinacia oleracea TaxID=3562 RepID=A0ABM3R658_SPIOL|nr:protein kinase STUNTED-like isoform X2 [Spinacia oleracea]
MDALSIICGRKNANLPQFLSLRRLKLSFLNYSSWDVLTKLLECSPNLEVLVLSKDFKGKDAKFRRDSIWIQPISVPACLLSCLGQVEVLDCGSDQVEFDLISYLLKHGEVLSTFLVELLPANSRKDLRFRDKLMVIPRVSSTCQLKISAYARCSQQNGFSSDKEENNLKDLQRWITPQRLSYEDLRLCTNYFSGENLIARTKEFKIYRGKLYQSGSLVKDVVVKKWVIPAKSPYNKHKEDSLCDFHEELKLLKHQNFCCHSYFMNLLGYCAEDNGERLGVVYDFKVLDGLENLIPKDSLKWVQRIKVALVLACILEYMHKKHGDLPSVPPSINPANIIVNEDYMPVLSDFNRREIRMENNYREEDNYNYNSIEYADLFSRNDYDVEQYGLTVLALISKRVGHCPIKKRHVCERVTLDQWAKMQKKDLHINPPLCKSQVSLVHKDLMDDPTYDFVDGLKITRLAMHCLDRSVYLPSMYAIVKYLCKLRVVKENWDVIDHDNIISSYLDVQVP